MRQIALPAAIRVSQTYPLICVYTRLMVKPTFNFNYIKILIISILYFSPQLDAY
jgi:hypothetical protein